MFNFCFIFRSNSSNDSVCFFIVDFSNIEFIFKKSISHLSRCRAVLPEALLPDYHRLSQAERERAERLAAEAAQNVKTDNGKD